MRDGLTRRAFAALTASATAVPLAGCQSSGNGDDGESSGDGEAPIEYSSDTSVAFETPADADTAANGVTVSMTAENVTIEESGEVNDNAGHFHIMIDEGPVEAGEAIPNDETHLYYGDGSSRTVLDLDSGTHELTLQVGDGRHRAPAYRHRRDDRRGGRCPSPPRRTAPRSRVRWPPSSRQPIR